MNSETQKYLLTLLSQPIAVLVAFAWLLGIVIWVTWWLTSKASKFATWEGVARMITAAEESREKILKEHKDEDTRMFEQMANSYQKGMQISSEKFSEGMKLASSYLRGVTEELKKVNDKTDKQAIHLGEVRGALKVLIPKDKAEEIFKEAS